MRPISRNGLAPFLLVLPTYLLGLALAGPAAGQNETARPSVPKSEDGKLVEISGCLTGGPSSFMLTNVPIPRAVHAPPDVAIGTAGSTMTSYSLRGRDGVNLSPYVGKRVEIRGVLLAAAAAMPSTREPAEKPKKDDSPDVKAGSDAKTDPKVEVLIRPNVAVTAVRVLPAACP